MKTIIPVLFVCILTWSVAVAAEEAGAALRFSLKAGPGLRREIQHRDAQFPHRRGHGPEEDLGNHRQRPAAAQRRDLLSRQPENPHHADPGQVPRSRRGRGRIHRLEVRHPAQRRPSTSPPASSCSTAPTSWPCRPPRSTCSLAKNQQEKKEIDVRETVANTYHLVLLAEKNREILGSSLENLRRTWQETEAMHRAGFWKRPPSTSCNWRSATWKTPWPRPSGRSKRPTGCSSCRWASNQDRPVALSDTLASLLAAMDAALPAAEGFDLARHIDFRVHGDPGTIHGHAAQARKSGVPAHGDGFFQPEPIGHARPLQFFPARAGNGSRRPSWA